MDITVNINITLLMYYFESQQKYEVQKWYKLTYWLCKLECETGKLCLCRLKPGFSATGIWSHLTMKVFKGQTTVLVTIIGTYVELRQIRYFIVKKSHNFEGTDTTLCILMVILNKFKGFPSVSCWDGHFFNQRYPQFLSNRGHEKSSGNWWIWKIWQ